MLGNKWQQIKVANSQYDRPGKNSTVPAEKKEVTYTCFPGYWLLPMPKSNRSIFLLTSVYYTIHSSLIRAMEASKDTRRHCDG